jgi:hypothetical protein
LIASITSLSPSWGVLRISVSFSFIHENTGLEAVKGGGFSIGNGEKRQLGFLESTISIGCLIHHGSTSGGQDRQMSGKISVIQKMAHITGPWLVKWGVLPLDIHE